MPLAVSFLCHFPSAFAAWVAPASCPAVSGLSSSHEGPRSPGLRRKLYPRYRVRAGSGNRRAHVEPAPALGAEDAALRQVQHELAAHEALQARAAQQRVELLLEAAVQRLHGHSERNTPVTLPRIWTWSVKIGSSSSFSGCRRTRRPSLKKRLTVASSAVSSSPASATTMSPSWAVCSRRTTTRSPSRIPAFTIESPLTRSRNSSPP